MTTEIYYYNISEAILSQSQIDYVQLESNTPYNGFSFLQQADLYEESDGNKSGKWYSTFFVQEDSSDNTQNISVTTTLSLKDGILVFTSDSEKLKLVIGNTIYAKPIYKSGIYLKQDVQIIRDVIDSQNGLLAKFIVTY